MEVEVEVVEVEVAEEVVVVAAHHLQQLRGWTEVAVHEVGGAVLRPRREHAVHGLALHRAVPSFGYETTRPRSSGMRATVWASRLPRTWHESVTLTPPSGTAIAGAVTIARALGDIMAQRKVEADGGRRHAAGLGS